MYTLSENQGKVELSIAAAGLLAEKRRNSASIL